MSWWRGYAVLGIALTMMGYAAWIGCTASELFVKCGLERCEWWEQPVVFGEGKTLMLQEWRREDVELLMEKKLVAGKRRAQIVEMSRLSIRSKLSGVNVVLSNEFVQGWVRYHEGAVRRFNAGQEFRMSCGGKAAPLVGIMVLVAFSLLLFFVSYRLFQEVEEMPTPETGNKQQQKDHKKYR